MKRVVAAPSTSANAHTMRRQGIDAGEPEKAVHQRTIIIPTVRKVVTK
jgi:hypothetical protein